MKNAFAAAIIAACLLSGSVASVEARLGRSGDAGGADLSPGSLEYAMTIPTALPAPKNQQWVDRLRQALAGERRTLARFEADSRRYGQKRLYSLAIAQEQNYINWLGRLFAAYGLPTGLDAVEPEAPPSPSRKAAYEAGVQHEVELIPQYVWLVENAEDKDSSRILDTIMREKRHHQEMFQKALAKKLGRSGR